MAFPSAVAPAGGPGSFQGRLTAALKDHGHRVTYEGDREVPDVILVIGGTSKVRWLTSCKRRGARIVHRLDGLNWRQRVLPTGLRIQARRIARNKLMAGIRNRLADHVVYQSKFVSDWWHSAYGPASCGESIIHNGVDLSIFAPGHEGARDSERGTLLCVEGEVQDDPVTTGILATLPPRLLEDDVVGRTLVCGKVTPSMRARLQDVAGLHLAGPLPRETMPSVFSSSSVFLNLEINPPCPNSVIEALAAGVPVVGFDTGALAELVSPEAGVLVPYGADPWQIEEPDLPALEAALKRVLEDRASYSRHARADAEKRFGLDRLLAAYMSVFDTVTD